MNVEGKYKTVNNNINKLNLQYKRAFISWSNEMLPLVCGVNNQYSNFTLNVLLLF